MISRAFHSTEIMPPRAIPSPIRPTSLDRAEIRPLAGLLADVRAMAELALERFERKKQAIGIRRRRTLVDAFTRRRRRQTVVERPSLLVDADPLRRGRGHGGVPREGIRRFA
jgi:hypothetical protein